MCPIYFVVWLSQNELNFTCGFFLDENIKYLKYLTCYALNVQYKNECWRKSGYGFVSSYYHQANKINDVMTPLIGTTVCIPNNEQWTIAIYTELLCLINWN